MEKGKKRLYEVQAEIGGKTQTVRVVTLQTEKGSEEILAYFDSAGCELTGEMLSFDDFCSIMLATNFDGVDTVYVDDDDDTDADGSDKSNETLNAEQDLLLTDSDDDDAKNWFAPVPGEVISDVTAADEDDPEVWFSVD